MASHEDFVGASGTAFAHVAGELILHEVSDVVEQHGVRSYSVLFHGPRDSGLSQGIHRLHNDDLGDLELFFVPVGLDGDVARYEAVFSTIVEEAT